MLDNYATHKTPEVKAWLDKHPRFKLHFTPTSASWLNLVERFFAKITSRRIRRGSYSCVDDLKTAIYDYLAQHNEKPKPFRWTKTAEDNSILPVNDALEFIANEGIFWTWTRPKMYKVDLRSTEPLILPTDRRVRQGLCGNKPGHYHSRRPH